jgi:hypothetical protein
VYDKAGRRATAERPERGPSAAALFAREQALAEARSELWLARFAVPGALVGAWIVVHNDLGQALCRIVAGMWMHEFGHATVAWICGYPAFPAPWFTPMAAERSALFALALAGGLGYAAWTGWTEEDRGRVVGASSALALQLVGTLLLSEHAAQQLILFGGGMGSLVFGTACMATFYAPPGHKLHRDWLRWGLLVLGAAAFCDTFYDWWQARAEPEVIAFGEIEGHGATDQSRLVDDFGWSVATLVRRYFGLGVVCLFVLTTLQVLHLRRTRRALDELV